MNRFARKAVPSDHTAARRLPEALILAAEAASPVCLGCVLACDDVMVSMDSENLINVVRGAADCIDAMSAVRNIYARLQVEINRRMPVCVASGKCCNFDAYGHRLYVTTLELATFVEDLKSYPVTRASGPCSNLPNFTTISLPTLPARAEESDHDQATQGGCPLQDGKLCGVHTIRPFGCRIFFCDPTATDWQQQQYESFHAELKQLHERFDIPYMYVEWRAALAALAINTARQK